MQNDLITMTGGVGTAPDHQFTKNGKERTRFRLASDVRRRNAEGEWETVSTSWYTVTCWGALARNVRDSVVKGNRIVVHGRLRIDEYVDEQGAKRTAPEINADVIGPDLTFGIARFAPRERSEVADRADEHAPDATAPADGEAVPTGVDARTGEVLDDAPADPALAGAGLAVLAGAGAPAPF